MSEELSRRTEFHRILPSSRARAENNCRSEAAVYLESPVLRRVAPWERLEFSVGKRFKLKISKLSIKAG